MKRRQFVKAILASTLGFSATVVATSVVAKPGRPASPNSVAGVNRRTRRRRRRRRVRRGMRLTSLPYGCRTTRVRGGVNYYYCGGIWYQPVYQGTTVVYIVEEIEPGAETDVEFEEYE